MAVVLVVKPEVRVTVGALPVRDHLERTRACSGFGFHLKRIEKSLKQFKTKYVEQCLLGEMLLLLQKNCGNDDIKRNHMKSFDITDN